jgi:hypothetical protein
MNENSELPQHLLRYLADSEFEVVSLNKERLSVRVHKEIGPEHGLLEFREPSFVCIQPKLAVAAITIGSFADLPIGLRELMRPNDKQLDESETLYLIDGSWGERFFVIATEITYSVTN